MDPSWHGVGITPYCGNCRSKLLPQFHGVHNVSSRTFDGSNVKTHPAELAICTPDVKLGVAPTEMTRDCGASFLFAEFALLEVPLWWYQSEALRWLEDFSVTKFDLWNPDRASDMSPVIARRLLERFPWIFSTPGIVLMLPEEFHGFHNHFSLLFLLVPLPI
jgi:hypothetical protein